MGSQDIIALKFPANVRCRPGMYIGSTDNADILLREIIDNSVDEMYACESCNKINVVTGDNFFLVADSGRGIPIKKSLDDDSKTMAYQSIMELHAGSKFNKTDIQIGMNGVGSSVVNALSEEYWLVCKIDKYKVEESTEAVKEMFRKVGRIRHNFYVAKAKHGVIYEEMVVHVDQLMKLIPQIPEDSLNDLGTLVYVKPDPTMFSSVKASLPNTLQYIKYIMKYRKRNVSIIHNGKESESLFVPYKYDFRVIVNSPITNSRNPRAEFLLSFELNEDFDRLDHTGSVNGLVVDRGVHKTYIEWAFSNAMAQVYHKDFKGYDLLGLKINTILLCPEPEFSSQTKERLSKIPGFDFADLKPVINNFKGIIRSHPEEFDKHAQRVIQHMGNMKNLSKIELIRSKIPIVSENHRSGTMIPIKVVDCTCTNRKETELFVVEGSSAGNCLIQARDSRYHAVLPLKGKPMNTVHRSIEDILNNREMYDLIAAIGLGTNDYYNLSEIRYGKIILLADGDPDGQSINALVLGMFIAHMSFLIENGFVYIVDIPLYHQDGKYFFSDEFDKLDKSKHFDRFKGLGESNPSQLHHMALSEHRRLRQFTIDNTLDAVNILTSTWRRRQLLVDTGDISMKTLQYHESILG